MRTVQLIALALSAAMISGCGKSDKPASSAQGEVKIATTSQGVVATDGKGTKVTASASGNAALPENFPKDVPIITGAKIGVATALPDATSVILGTPASPEEAAKFYAENLKAQGWKVESPQNVAGRTLLQAKKDKREFTAGILKAEGGSTIQIMVTGK